jgi:TrmH family RNA methyltransferase
LLNSEELDRLRVVLVSTRNSLNIGAAARAMSNFGVMRLRVVNPYEPAFREARSAVGASALLEKAEEYTDVAEAIADCTLVVGTSAVGARGLNHPLKRLEVGAAAIREHLQSGRVAILFGSEKFGLSNQQLSYCNWLMRIPTREEHFSMNLGQAVAICLYELIRDSKSSQAGTYNKSPDQGLSLPDNAPATAGQVERFAAKLIEALHASGYVNPAASTDEKVRRLVLRLQLQARDVETWLGVLRQLMWKMRSGEIGSERESLPGTDRT